MGAPVRTEVNANDVVAFLVELAALALLAVWGYETGGPLWARLALAVGLPLVAAVLWGLFAAPRARVRVPWLTLVVKLLVLGAAVVAGFAVLAPVWAGTFAVVVAANLVLMYVGPLAR